MKVLAVSILLCWWIAGARAAEWKVAPSPAGSNIAAFATLPDHPGWKIPMRSVGGDPKYIEWRVPADKAAPAVGLFIYSAGTAGTSTPLDVQRAVVILLKTGKVLLDAPWDYAPLDESASEPMQPRWTWSKRSVSVVDTSTGAKLGAKW